MGTEQRNKRYVVYLPQNCDYDLKQLGSNIDFELIYSNNLVSKKYELESLAVKLIEGHRLLILDNTIDAKFIIGMWVSIHGYNSLIYYRDKDTGLIVQFPKANYLYLFSPISNINNLDENKYNMYIGYCSNKKSLKRDIFKYDGIYDFIDKCNYYSFTMTFIRYRRFILEYSFW